MVSVYTPVLFMSKKSSSEEVRLWWYESLVIVKNGAVRATARIRTTAVTSRFTVIILFIRKELKDR